MLLHNSRWAFLQLAHLQWCYDLLVCCAGFVLQWNEHLFKAPLIVHCFVLEGIDSSLKSIKLIRFSRKDDRNEPSKPIRVRLYVTKGWASMPAVYVIWFSSNTKQIIQLVTMIMMMTREIFSCAVFSLSMVTSWAGTGWASGRDSVLKGVRLILETTATFDDSPSAVRIRHSALVLTLVVWFSRSRLPSTEEPHFGCFLRTTEIILR